MESEYVVDGCKFIATEHGKYSLCIVVAVEYMSSVESMWRVVHSVSKLIAGEHGRYGEQC